MQNVQPSEIFAVKKLDRRGFVRRRFAPGKKQDRDGNGGGGFDCGIHGRNISRKRKKESGLRRNAYMLQQCAGWRATFYKAVKLTPDASLVFFLRNHCPVEPLRRGCIRIGDVQRAICFGEVGEDIPIDQVGRNFDAAAQAGRELDTEIKSLA